MFAAIVTSDDRCGQEHVALSSLYDQTGESGAADINNLCFSGEQTIYYGVHIAIAWRRLFYF